MRACLQSSHNDDVAIEWLFHPHVYFSVSLQLGIVRAKSHGQLVLIVDMDPTSFHFENIRVLSTRILSRLVFCVRDELKAISGTNIRGCMRVCHPGLTYEYDLLPEAPISQSKDFK